MQTIPSNILKVSPICSNTEIIFLSAIGSLNADVKLNAIVITASFIIGIAHIESTTIIPTNPTAFFKILPHPKTASTVSPKSFPTTGIVLVTTALVVFTVSPSTELVSVPFYR